MSIDRPSTPHFSLTIPAATSNPFTQPPGPRSPTSPLRFPTSSSAFALPAAGSAAAVPPPAFASSSANDAFGRSSTPGAGPSSVSGTLPSPTFSSGSASGNRRLRRPSMLSLTQGPIESEDEADKSESLGAGGELTVGDSRASGHSRLGGARIAPLSPIIPGKRPPAAVERDRDRGRERDRGMKEDSTDLALSSGPSRTDTPDQATRYTDFGMSEDHGIESSASSSPPVHRPSGSTEDRPSPIWISNHLNAHPPHGLLFERPDTHGLAETADIGIPEFPADETIPSAPLPTPANSPPESVPTSNNPGQGFSGRPLPASLLATLISERSPAQHEIASEARFQRVLHSHPRALPFTPRQARSTRGRYPEMIEDDEDMPSSSYGMSGRGDRSRWRKHSWTGMGSSDSDSDDEMDFGAPSQPFSGGLGGARGSASTVEDGEVGVGGSTGGVGEIWAGGMEMDRPTSSHSSFSVGTGPLAMSSIASGPANGPDSTRSTPARGGSGWQGALKGRMHAQLASSPGTGLHGAFGGLGVRTPLGSPTVEKVELVGSPGSGSMGGSFGLGTPGSSQPGTSVGATGQRPGSSGGAGSASWKSALGIGEGMMAYRESSAGQASSGRANKRKAHTQSGTSAGEEARYDPYKRQRATSPSVHSSPGYPGYTGYGAYATYPMSPSRSGPGSSSGLASAPTSGNGSNLPPSFLPVVSASAATASPGSGPGTTPSVPVPASPSSHPLWNPHRRAHPYTRPLPISSRSRAVSPALSIGSTSGVLSSSFGKERDGTLGGRQSVQLGQAFIPTGMGSLGVGSAQGEGGQGLGSLGLLSLSSRIVEERSGSEGGEEGEDNGNGETREREESRRGSGDTEVSEGGAVGVMDQD